MFIDLKKAVKKYSDGDETVFALDHASFELEEGKLCVILGPSGSGKSTLLNMLGGLDTMDEGELTVAGRRVTGLSVDKRTDYRREDVGFVFQFYNLIPDLTAEENIEVVADLTKTPLDMEAVLTALDIAKYRRRFPKELSGGQQQRVAIARAMIKNPKLLLCDELTGALDTRSSRSVLKFVECVNRQFGTTVVIITHNEAISGMADCVIRLKDGQIFETYKNERKIPAEDLVL
ncbi:MAG: ABC transporter ATP-binding protein [Lachnospiraceae bacterium]|nr:ABC transporter ATP-binding protein [Lachnospiraceae bacterium]